MDSINAGNIAVLPKDCLLTIFYNLSPLELAIAGCVSKAWHSLSNDDRLWKALCDKKGWSPFGQPSIGQIAWKEVYKAGRLPIKCAIIRIKQSTQMVYKKGNVLSTSNNFKKLEGV